MNDMTHSFVIDRATVAPAVKPLPIPWVGTFDEAVTNLEKAEAAVEAVNAEDEDELARVVNAMQDAVYDLMETPAPNLAGLLTKLVAMEREDRNGLESAADWRASIITDAINLAALTVTPHLSGAVSNIEGEIDRHFAGTMQQSADWKNGIRPELGPDDSNPHVDAGCKLYDRIEALPCTPEYARVRAKAILDIYDGDLSEFASEKETSDFRLAKQIVESLVIGA